MSELNSPRTIAPPLPAVSERLIQRRQVQQQEPVEWQESFDHAEQIIDDAMNYSGINKLTAPVRWEAARRAAAYATYVALGITRDSELMLTAKNEVPEDNKAWRSRLMSVDHISRFESRVSQSRIGEE